jgi:hypothetical protein
MPSGLTEHLTRFAQGGAYCNRRDLILGLDFSTGAGAISARNVQVPKHIALPEPTMPVARECRVIRNPAVELEVTKPAIGQVEMDLLAQPPLGPDAHAVADNQHPHHQLGINRGAPDVAVERLQLRAHLLEVEEPVNASEQVIFGNMVVKAEIVKQLRRRRLHPHHRPRSSANQYEDGITPANADQRQTKSTISARSCRSETADWMRSKVNSI